MTFKNDEIRLAFHVLPTSKQSSMVSMDERLALLGQEVCIEGVSYADKILEVIVRITMRDKLSANPGAAVPGLK
jgi:hypothetical protein